VELAVRKDSDRFVKQGAYGALQARLRRQSGKLAEIPTVVLSAFDRSTRLLPFLFYDTLMFPAGAGAIANALNQAGFARTRAVFQLWNPNFKLSRARFDGRAIEMLLISSMHINSQRAYDAISEAWSLEPSGHWSLPAAPRRFTSHITSGRNRGSAIQLPRTWRLLESNTFCSNCLIHCSLIATLAGRCVRRSSSLGATARLIQSQALSISRQVPVCGNPC